MNTTSMASGKSVLFCSKNLHHIVAGIQAECRYISITFVIEYVILLNYPHLVSVLEAPNPAIKTTHPPMASTVKNIEETAACEQERCRVICIYNITQLRCALY